MSMWLTLARLSPAGFQYATQTPAALDGVFLDRDPSPELGAFDRQADVWGMDYRTLDAMLQAMYGVSASGEDALTADEDDHFSADDEDNEDLEESHDEVPLDDEEAEENEGTLAPSTIDEPVLAVDEDDTIAGPLPYDQTREAQQDPLFQLCRGEYLFEGYAFTYGTAFYFRPETVARIAQDLAAEYGADPGEDDDEDEISALIRFVQEAAARGDYLVGGVN